MATQKMTKFVAGSSLYLKSPTDDQTDTVLAWMLERKLEVVSIKEGEAVFTPSGKGKPAPAVEIQFTAPSDPLALDKLTALYPGPKSLAGVKMVDPETEADEIKSPSPGEVQAILAEADCIPGTKLTEGDLEIINQENSLAGEPELTREDAIAAAQELLAPEEPPF